MIVQRQIVPYAGRQPSKITLGDIAPIADIPSPIPGISQSTLMLLGLLVGVGAFLVWQARKFQDNRPERPKRKKSHNVHLSSALLWAGGAAAIAYFAGKSNRI